MASEVSLDTLSADLTRMARLSLAQLQRGLRAFRASDLAEAEETIERDDVVDNLNLAIEDRCFALAATGSLTEGQLRKVRATAKVAANLERIGDAGTHIAKRVRLLYRDGVDPVPFSFEEMDARALLAVEEASEAFLRPDLEMAHRACLREPEFDGLYVRHIVDVRSRMQAYPSQITYLMHVLSVLKYLEKVLDYVLNIGEQAIFLVTGRRLKFSQMQQLDRLVGHAAPGALEFRPYWDGISGAVVAQLSGGESPLIYKEGGRRKIQAEADKLDAWGQVAGDLAPRVLRTITVRDRQALLREFVEGVRLSDLYLSDASRDQKLAVTKRLWDAVAAVWRNTLRHEAPRLDYVRQTRDRLPDVFTMHPELPEMAFGGDVDLDHLLDRAAALEPGLAPPVSVWLHGDFNASNVIYHEPTDQLKFIDVHRSHHGDYLQDVSVFLLSMQRRPGLSPAVQGDVQAVNEFVESFARAFAEQHGDRAFAQRLKISLARSCITSSRIVVDPLLAARLLRRGVDLLRELTDPGEPPDA